MAQFLDYKEDFLNIFSKYVYANIKVLDMNTLSLILTLMGLNECYVMHF